MRLGVHRLAAVVAGVLTAIAAAALPFRGLNLWALWQVESVERFARWLDSGDETLMGAAFDNSPGVLPTVPRLVAMLFDDALLGVRVLGALAAGVCVYCMVRLVTRAAGFRAALLAFAALVVIPRFWAMATVPSATVFLVAAVLSMWTACIAARDDWRWTPVFLLVLTAALGVHPAAWLFLLPLAWMVLVEPGTIRRGRVQIRAVGLWMLVVPSLSLMLFVVVHPYFHDDTATRVAELLNVWLERPAEPFLYRGSRLGSARILPHVPLHLLAITIPGALAAAACGGVYAIRGLSVAARHDLWSVGLFLLFLPFLLRSVYFGGADLLALGAIFVAMLSGIGLNHALTAVHGRFGSSAGVALIVGALVVSAVDVSNAGTRFEAYYSGLIGGTRGAVDRGHSRYAHPPVPVAELAALSESGVRRLAILTNGWELRPVIGRYRELGIVAADFELVEITEAQAIVIHLDDTLPELYPVLRDMSLFVSGAPSSAMIVGDEAAPLIVFGRIAE